MSYDAPAGLVSEDQYRPQHYSSPTTAALQQTPHISSSHPNRALLSGGGGGGYGNGTPRGAHIPPPPPKKNVGGSGGGGGDGWNTFDSNDYDDDNGTEVPYEEDNAINNVNNNAVELEVAKRLLQAKVTLTIQRYDQYISNLIDDYFSGVRERRILYNASRAICAPLIPFGSGGAEERSASLRFERMLIAASKSMEVELNAFRTHCFDIQAEWQKEFLRVCQNASENEKRRKDDFLNLTAVCRKEVGATTSRLKAEFANKAVALEEMDDLRQTVEILKEEATSARQALQEARRLAAEDRARYFKEREAATSEFTATLQAERENFARRIKDLDESMEKERNQHATEFAAAAQRHARTMAELNAQLSEVRESNAHYISDASCARGEALAERKAFVEERNIMQRYVRELEAALVEVGGRPDLVPSSRAAQQYMAAAVARKERLLGGGGSFGGGGGNEVAAIVAASAYLGGGGLMSTPRGGGGGAGAIAAALEAASPRSTTRAAAQQQHAQSVVDAMLGERGVAAGVSSPFSSQLQKQSLSSGGVGGGAASLLPTDYRRALHAVTGEGPSFLHQMRSPSVEGGGGGGGGGNAALRGSSVTDNNPPSSSSRGLMMGPSPSARSRSPSTPLGTGSSHDYRYGGGGGQNNNRFSPSDYGNSNYKQPSFASPSLSAAEKARTLRNQGGTLSSGASPGGGYFSSRR